MNSKPISEDKDKVLKLMEELGVDERGKEKWIKHWIKTHNIDRIGAEAEWIIFLQSIKDYRKEKSNSDLFFPKDIIEKLE